MSAHEGEELREAEQGQHLPPRLAQGAQCAALRCRGVKGSRVGGFAGGGRFLMWLEPGELSGSLGAEEGAGRQLLLGTWPRSRLPAALSSQDVLELAFSVVYDVEEYCLNFVAPTRYEVSPKGGPVALPGDGGWGRGLCVQPVFLGWEPQQRGEAGSPAAPGCCSAPPVLPLDRRAERAPGQGDDE